MSIPDLLCPNISIVVCARNEEQNIEPVLTKCKAITDEIIVIEGNSTDQTFDVASKHTKFIFRDSGAGKGAAIREGIKQATREIIVFVDADGSHDPADIPNLVEPIQADLADHVTGSRMQGGSDELAGDFNQFLRRTGSDIITLMINRRFQVRLTDSQNGFRAIKTKVARNLGLSELITTIEQEMIIKTLRKGYRMAEVSTHEYRRMSGVSCIRIRKVAFRYVFSAIKYLYF